MSVKKFAKLTDGAISFAPKFLRLPGRVLVNPTDADYLAAGYSEVAADEPNPPDGEVVAATSYETREDGLIHKVFVYGPAPAPAPRVFSKLFLRIALTKRGLAETFDAWLDASGFRSLWTDCNELSESYEGFADISRSVCAALGLDEETRDEILGEAVAR